ncbi:MAG: UvrD-helicase domain-containing protein [Burkholderiales bacterium]
MKMQLNPNQSAAVKYLDGPLLVLAGAGSGKTRVITQKIAYLIEQCGYDAINIAAITFTNKAAREMGERVAKLMGGPQKGLTVSTFHALGMRILRSEATALNMKPKFSILNADDSFGIIAEICKSVDKKFIEQNQWIISRWKNDFVSPIAAGNIAANENEQLAAKIYRYYQATLHAYQAVDFDDLIRLPVELFERDKDILDKWQNRLRYLLIDEYQDTNACQYKLVKLLTGGRGLFTAVGDDDQAIYAWRGANVENLRTLQSDFRNLHVIKLEQNYRSTVRILKAANNLMGNNPKLFEKKLWSELCLGDAIKVTTAKDDDAEAETVVMDLLAHQFQHRTSLGDYAILYRGNHQARAFEQQLRNQKTAYEVSGGMSFFDYAEIKDLTAYLRLIANADDDPAFIRAVATPRRGVGASTLELLGQFGGEHKMSLFEAACDANFQSLVAPKQLEPLQEFIKLINGLEFNAQKQSAESVLEDLVKQIGYEIYLFDSDDAKKAEVRWNNVRQFIDWLSKKSEAEDKNLFELTQTIALINLLENREDKSNAVQLSTLHAAKGLEFKHVYLVGVEENILPHRESLEGAKIEEERRLMYVGITRAQRTLHITLCQKRKRAREFQVCEPSRFIAEMGKEDLKFSGDHQPQEVGKAEGSSRLAALKAMLDKAPAEAVD